MEYGNEEKISLGCEHFFCNSCLQSYTVYKISSFEEVVCPEEGCKIILSLDD